MCGEGSFAQFFTLFILLTFPEDLEKMYLIGIKFDGKKT